VWLAICTLLLVIPGNDLPSSSFIGEWAKKIFFDKWVHFGMFAITVALWCWAFSNKPASSKKIYYLSITILWIAYGIAMEYVQRYFVEYRSFDIYDMLADAAGAFAGYLFSRKWL
jgi:VanZ family protein